MRLSLQLLMTGCQVFFLSSIFSQAALAAATCSLKNDKNVYNIMPMAKPGYLQTGTEPTFGTPIKRITGDPGTAIKNVSGGIWGTRVHHQYSKLQVWNADQSLIFIETNRDSGGTGPVFLDGSTYMPLFAAHCPGSECRWHPTNPQIMVYVGLNQLGYWNPRTNTKTVIASFSGYKSLGIGPWEGNLSLDGSKIVINGLNSSGATVAFAYDLVNNVKYPDILISSFASHLNWASISPNGNRVVVTYDADQTNIYDLNGNKTLAFQSGHPSHYDMTVDQNGDEVAVGKAVYGAPYSGLVIKVRLSDGAMSPLTTGGYARHSSTRATNNRTWGVSSMETVSNYPPYNAEIDLFNTDGSVVYRLAHHRSLYTDYDSEVLPTISPDGLRVIFASNWGDSSGRPMQVYVIDLRQLCGPPPPTTSVLLTPPAVSDTLLLQVSEDAYQGDAKFTVTIDGVAFGGMMTATANHAAGQSQSFKFTGSWGAGTRVIRVTFMNDAWGGTPSNDRNLYVDSITYRGIAGGSTVLYSNGTATFNITAP